MPTVVGRVCRVIGGARAGGPIQPIETIAPIGTIGLPLPRGWAERRLAGRDGALSFPALPHGQASAILWIKSQLKMKGTLGRPVDAFEEAGLWAVELLIPLTVFFRELDHQFNVRAMKACVGRDITVAAPKDALQVRYAPGKKSNTSAACRFHQRAFDHCRGSASYTFHNINIRITFHIIRISIQKKLSQVMVVHSLKYE